MKSIIENMELVNTNRRAYVPVSPFCSSELSLVQKDIEFYNKTFGGVDKYQLIAKIGVTITCTEAQLEKNILQAKKLLMRRVYGEAHMILDELRFAISNYELERAEDLCTQMEKVFNGGDV